MKNSHDDNQAAMILSDLVALFDEFAVKSYGSHWVNQYWDSRLSALVDRARDCLDNEKGNDAGKVIPSV